MFFIISCYGLFKNSPIISGNGSVMRISASIIPNNDFGDHKDTSGNIYHNETKLKYNMKKTYYCSL